VSISRVFNVTVMGGSSLGFTRGIGEVPSRRMRMWKWLRMWDALS